MRAVLAACCLFAVYLLFRSADSKAPGAAAPPPPPEADADEQTSSNSGTCVDIKEEDICVSWKAANYCLSSTYTKENCANTCNVC
uniref:ShKL10 n=1 Tax=Colubraria reticulata TaxID=604273 RepID=A0A481SPM1_9CAEN|nr:ShKL10 [Colubraria reticulata]